MLEARTCLPLYHSTLEIDERYVARALHELESAARSYEDQILRSRNAGADMTKTFYQTFLIENATTCEDVVLDSLRMIPVSFLGHGPSKQSSNDYKLRGFLTV